MISSSSDLLARVDAIVKSNLANENFNIAQLANELSLSYAHTYRKIKEFTGLSPSIYIRNKRLERACQFLVNSDLTINQIAFRVGFKTQSYFSAKFSAFKGYSPKEYRKQNGV